MLDLFFGAAEHRLLLGHLPMTDDFIAEVVDVILAGIQRSGQSAPVIVAGEQRPSASISTSQAGSSRPATITAVAAGRIAAKTSPCARATSSPVLRGGQVHAGADHVLQAGSGLGQGLADQVQAEPGLGVRAGRGRAAAGRHRRGAGHQDPVPGHHARGRTRTPARTGSAR